MKNEKLTERQKKHREYIRSTVWAEKKEWFRRQHDWPICQGCGAWDVPLHVHHLTYARTGGNELLEDLAFMCEPCHFDIHKHQILARKRRNEKPKKVDKNGLTRRQRKRRAERRRKGQKIRDESQRVERVKKYMELQK